MIVAELIELLKRVDPEALVYSDGCDCVDVAEGIHVSVKPDEVTIVRRVYDRNGVLLKDHLTPKTQKVGPGE